MATEIMRGIRRRDENVQICPQVVIRVGCHNPRSFPLRTPATPLEGKMEGWPKFLSPEQSQGRVPTPSVCKLYVHAPVRMTLWS